MDRTPFKELQPTNPRLSIRDYNRLVRTVKNLLRSNFAQGLMDSSGFHNRSNAGLSPVVDSLMEFLSTKIASVQESATGTGIYTCVLLIIDGDNWTDETGKDKLELDGPTLWVPNRNYLVDDIVYYDGSYYACINNHTSSEGSPPPNANWVKVWPWGYATAAWDSETSYIVCDRVIYDGKHYHCIQANTNVIPFGNPNYWQETYKQGDYVYRSISGAYHFFKCTTTHVSASDKQPPNASYWENLFTFEVLNLYESNITEIPAVPLTEGARMVVWKFTDSGGTVRYAGVPFSLQTSKIFEVQSAATGNGVYICYEQTLDATDWNDTTGADKLYDKNTDDVEVLNLLENDPVSDYTPMLGKYDRIQAWQIVDDENNSCWVGIPLVNSVRQVKATEDAPAADHITCNLRLNNGAEAAEGELGYNIEVYGNFVTGTNLDEVTPRITTDKWLSARNEQGKWIFTTDFWKLNICET